MRFLIVLALVGCSSGAAVTRKPRARPPTTQHVVAPFPADAPFRLPHTFEPARYRVRIALGDKQLTGHVEIDGQVSEALEMFWLHGVDVVVSRAVARRDGREVAMDASAPRPDQVIGFRPATALEPGTWTLAIDYTAPIHDEGRPTFANGMKWDAPGFGVFRRVADGRSYIFTQGEAIYTRWFVPCVDEPDRKVPWQLTLEVDKSLVAASNTPIMRETMIDATHKRVEFAETKPLPSYLLAFAVGPFEVVEVGKSASGVPVRVLAIAERSAKVAEAAKVAPQLLDHYEQYLGVPYAYGKLDLVAVPRSGWGAMENPGLITVDQAIFEGPDSESTLSHEIAHQWFGDLVTCKWWDDIWLNESFAQFFAADGRSDSLDMRQESLAWLEMRMDVHAPASSNEQLELPAFAPDPQLRTGTAILRAIAGHLGRERFAAALRAYLTAHAHGNASTPDLFDRLGREYVPLLAGQVPRIKASLSCTNKTHELVVTSGIRPVSMCVAYDRDGMRATTCATVEESRSTIPLPSRACPTWVLPNVDGSGVYQTDWEPFMDGLIQHGWKSITPTERRTVFAELGDMEPRKITMLALVADDDAGSADMASYVEQIARYVPSDLRLQFNTWVRSHYARVRSALHLVPAADIAYEQFQRQFVLARLLLEAGDEGLAKEADAIAARYPSSIDEAFAGPAVASAASRDATIATRLFDTLGGPDAKLEAWSVDVLSSLPNIADLVAKDPKRFAQLVGFGRVRLLLNVCDPDSRKTLASILGTQQAAYDPLPEIDRCIAKRKLLEPAFRAWLAPKRRK